jgi:hypothetical protein
MYVYVPALSGAWKVTLAPGATLPLLNACGVVDEVRVCVVLSLLVTVMVAPGSTVRAIGLNMKFWMTIVSEAAEPEVTLAVDPAAPVEVDVDVVFDVEEQPASSITAPPAMAVAAVRSGRCCLIFALPLSFFGVGRHEPDGPRRGRRDGRLAGRGADRPVPVRP